MKRILAVLLAGLLMVSLAACGQETETKDTAAETEAAEAATEAEPVMVGGYTEPDSPAVTEEIKALLQKATEELDGAEYTPVAFLGTQVVAGTNYLILCKITPVVPDAKTTYALVTLYEDLEGKAEIASVQNSEAEAPVFAEDGTVLAGGYAEPETPDVTDEAKAALEKACEGLDGASYEAKALLGTQVVAGLNYKLLCKVTPIVPDAASKYAVVTVYQDLDGNAQITETVEFAEA